jgi:hypothetical protein
VAVREERTVNDKDGNYGPETEEEAEEEERDKEAEEHLGH